MSRKQGPRLRGCDRPRLPSDSDAQVPVFPNAFPEEALA
jgi:hypothetical protein